MRLPRAGTLPPVFFSPSQRFHVISPTLYLILKRGIITPKSIRHREELVYIEKGSGSDCLRLCEFSSASNPVINLGDIEALSTAWWLGHDASAGYTTMIAQCSNVVFSVDAAPPNTRFVGISFDIVENQAVRHYQINAGLNGWAGHLLNSDDTAIVSDDD